MWNRVNTVLIILLMVLLSACLSTPAEDADQQLQRSLSGQLLIWHTWEGEQRASLQRSLENFMELNPGLSIIEEAYPFDEMEEAFRSQVEAGLGPDMLIGPSEWTNELAQEGLIRDIGPRELELDNYLTTALDMVRTEESLYGLPLSLNTMILYYNQNLLSAATSPASPTAPTTPEPTAESQAPITDTNTITPTPTVPPTPVPTAAPVRPAATLDELLQQANQGQRIALQTNFFGAFWGVQAFGGQLFDAEGRVVLNQGGFANWLNWLRQAQNNPNIILNRNGDELQQLFIEGRVTYYVGSTRELSMLQEAMGAEVVGVVRLPGRQNNAAGPVLQAEALMFNESATPRNLRLALNLAQYLTNAEQQRQFALGAGFLPANRTVRIDPRIAPAVAEFVAQGRTAVPIALPNVEKFNEVVSLGNDVYNQVLEGEFSVGQAVTELTERINDEYGLETPLVSRMDNCEISGRVTLWNTWTEAKSEVLTERVAEFQSLCPNTRIRVVDVDPVEMPERYIEAVALDDAPHLFIGPNRYIRALAPRDLLLNISEAVDPNFLQRFFPIVVDALVFEGNVYALPINANVDALYYNTSLVSDPPLVLDDLLAAVSPDMQAAIPIGFADSFWGLAAFGDTGTTTLFDDENRLVVDQSGLAEWLQWLREAQTQPGIVLNNNRAELETLFIEQRAGFLVSNNVRLSALQDALGAENVSVVPLPSGSPLLTVDTIFINPATTPDEQDIALLFAQFMTDVGSQVALMEQNAIPINININTANRPAITSFVEQVNAAAVLPNISQVNAIFEWGGLVYEQVLVNNLPADDAVQDFANLVNVTNGFDIDVPASTQVACPDEERNLELWATVSVAEELAWQQVISDFVQVCPTVTIALTSVPAMTFTTALTESLEPDSTVTPPDFFVTPHTRLQELDDLGIIRPVTSLIDENILADYLPESIPAVSHNEDVYGIPQSLHLPALYYQTGLVESPATTYEDLLIQARLGLTVGIETGFYDLFWGAAAFECVPCQSGQFFDESGELVLSRQDFEGWLAWLEEARNGEGFVFRAEGAMLEEMFLAGELAYVVADPDFLAEARSTLGVANVGVKVLPSQGEELLARPFMRVDAFFFMAEAGNEQTLLALEFARFAASLDSQTLLRQEGGYVPSHSLAVVTAEESAITPFITEIPNSILIPRQSQRNAIEISPVFRIFDRLADPEEDTSVQ